MKNISDVCQERIFHKEKFGLTFKSFKKKKTQKSANLIHHINRIKEEIIKACQQMEKIDEVLTLFHDNKENTLSKL